MAEQNTMQPGDFCWVELLTPDLESALTFYQSLMGWEKEILPISEDDSYMFFKIKDHPVAGAYQFNEEMKAMNMPAHWASHVWVENVDEMVAKAESLGATVLKEPFDVTEYGRMAVIADPMGAALSFWQPKQSPEESLPKQTPGMFGWNELITNDTKKSGQFYADLFGWELKTEEMEHGTIYTTFMNKGVPAGGMLQAAEEWGDAPSYWGIYFTVAHCDETIKKAEELGGKMLYEPLDIPTVGRFTMIEDPQGVYFSIIQFSS